MMKFDYLQRRVFIAHKQGGLHVRIFHNEGWTTGAIGFLLSTFLFAFVAWGLSEPFRHVGWSRELLYLLPFPILLILAYLIVLRIVIWKAFGQEEILVENGVFHWTCTSLWLKDELKTPTSEISAVSAVIRWFGDNRVEFTTQGRTYRVGEKILRDEAIQLAHALKRSIGLH
jgi:hypothetical protein